MKIIRILAIAAALIGGGSAYAEGLLVNAVVDVTPEGAAATLPSPTAPVYYFPFTVGYQEQGTWPASEPLPPTFTVLHTIAKGLAAQGYLLVNKKSPATILLTFRWGRMAPGTDEVRLANPNGSDFIASYGPDSYMATLVGGRNQGSDIVKYIGSNQPTQKWESFKLAVSVPRYFLQIEALDFAAAEQKRHVPLWSARVSTAAAGTTLEAALPALVAVAGPLLGRDTRPTQISYP